MRLSVAIVLGCLAHSSAFATPPAGAICEPVVRCGCFAGCGLYVPVAGQPSPSYALFGEDADDQVLYTRDEHGNLTNHDRPCSGACVSQPASYRCVKTAAATCAQKPLPAKASKRR